MVLTFEETALHLLCNRILSTFEEDNPVNVFHQICGNHVEKLSRQKYDGYFTKIRCERVAVFITIGKQVLLIKSKR